MRGIKILVGIVLVLAVTWGIMYYAYPRQSGDALTSAVWKYSGLEQKSVQVGDHKIVYLEGGQGDTVVLVHGFGGDKGNWSYFAPYLTNQYHVVIPDLPGFGNSTQIWTASYDYPEQISRLHQFMTKLDLTEVNLIGNSMGGEICGLYAAQYPKDVETLTLVDAAGVKAPRESEFNKLLAIGKNPLLVRKTSDFDRLMEFCFNQQPYIPGVLKQNMAADAAAHEKFNEKVFVDLKNHFALLQPQLAKIEAPVLIIWGDHDRVIDPTSVDVFKQGLKNRPAVAIIKDTGHLPMTEKPKETARAYLDFLAGVKNEPNDMQ